MATSFRRPLSVIRRTLGTFVQGVYVPAVEPAATGIMATVQPATAADYERMQAEQSGRRLDGLMRIYTDDTLTPAGATAAGQHPGDIAIIRGERYLVIGQHARDQLGTSVSHNRYLAVREAEGQGTGV